MKIWKNSSCKWAKEICLGLFSQWPHECFMIWSLFLTKLGKQFKIKLTFRDARMSTAWSNSYPEQTCGTMVVTLVGTNGGEEKVEIAK